MASQRQNPTAVTSTLGGCARRTSSSSKWQQQTMHRIVLARETLSGSLKGKRCPGRPRCCCYTTLKRTKSAAGRRPHPRKPLPTADPGSGLEVAPTTCISSLLRSSASTLPFCSHQISTFRPLIPRSRCAGLHGYLTCVILYPACVAINHGISSCFETTRASSSMPEHSVLSHGHPPSKAIQYPLSGGWLLDFM